MAKIKSVVELLAELPEDQLKRMREANRQENATAQAEIARLAVEGQQIEQALLKKQRDGSRTGRLTAQIVLDVLPSSQELAVSDVTRLLTEEGYETTPNAVRNHLVRLAERGQLLRVGDRYQRVAADIPSPHADDDIPF